MLSASEKRYRTLFEKSNDAIFLVVDDEPELLSIAQGLLQELGYRVLATDDCRSALTILAQQPAIDLLFSDVMMPGGMNGYQLAGVAAAGRPNLRVLLTSGFTERTPVHDNPAGFDRDLLYKPYTQAELARSIRKVLDRPRQR